MFDQEIKTIMVASQYEIIYRVFNYSECVFWILIGSCFMWKYQTFREDRRIWIKLLVPTLFLFGISDYFEATCYGYLPYWLWILKLGCGALLVVCRYGYVGINRAKFFDSFTILTAVLVFVVLFISFSSLARNSAFSLSFASSSSKLS